MTQLNKYQLGNSYQKQWQQKFRTDFKDDEFDESISKDQRQKNENNQYKTNKNNNNQIILYNENNLKSLYGKDQKKNITSKKRISEVPIKQQEKFQSSIKKAEDIKVEKIEIDSDDFMSFPENIHIYQKCQEKSLNESNDSYQNYFSKDAKQLLYKLENQNLQIESNLKQLQDKSYVSISNLSNHQLKAHNEQLSEMDKIRSSLHQRICENIEKQKQIEQLKQDLLNKTNQTESLKEIVNQLQNELQEKKQQLEESNRKIEKESRNNLQIKELETRLEIKQKAFDQLNQNIFQREQEFEEAKLQLAQQSQQFRDREIKLQQRLEKQSKDYQEMIEQTELKVQSMQQTHKEIYENMVSQHQNEIQQIVSGFEQELQAGQRNYEELANNLKYAREQLSEVEKQFVQIKEQNLLLNQNKEKILKELEEFQANNSLLKISINKQNYQLREEIENNKKLVSEYNKIWEENEYLSQVFIDLENKYQRLISFRKQNQ